MTFSTLVSAESVELSPDSRRTLRSCTPLEAPYVIYEGKSLCNFAGNDYLNLANHPLMIERSISYLKKYGANNQSSRLVTGNNEAYDRLERKLAQLTGFESALIFPSGYQLNASVIPSLMNASDFAWIDTSIHRSMVEGIKLSKARFKRFAHIDNQDLQARLEDRDAMGSIASLNQWIFAESIYSVDGSRHDLAQLLLLSKQYNCSLYIDDAHATGVTGVNGMGLAAGRSDITLAMGCFSKGLGAYGAYLLCSKLTREYLINRCPGLIYTTALPPSALGAIDASLELVPQLNYERSRLVDLSLSLQSQLEDLPFNFKRSESNIVSIYFETAERALALSLHLQNNGFLAVALRPPTTDKGTSAVRLSLNCAHSEQHIDQLANVLRRFRA